MQTVSVVLSTLHCQGYIADLRYIAGLLGSGKFHVVVLVTFKRRPRVKQSKHLKKKKHPQASKATKVSKALQARIQANYKDNYMMA